MAPCAGRSAVYSASASSSWREAQLLQMATSAFGPGRDRVNSTFLKALGSIPAAGVSESVGWFCERRTMRYQRLGQRRRDEAWARSDLHAWGHDPKKTKFLAPEARYCFAMLSSIFHELIFLHKALLATEPNKNAPDFVAAAHISQSTTLMRILVGKIWEARTRMNDPVMARTLRSEFFPLIPGQAERWKELNRAIASASWLVTLRNRHAFHFPTYEQIADRLVSNWPSRGATILGPSPGNCFFYDADQAMMLALFETASGELDDKRALIREFGEVLGSLYRMSSELAKLLSETLAMFVKARLWDGKRTEPLGEVSELKLQSERLPYFSPPATVAS